MAEVSSIEWTDATWNPVTGCSVVSPGCKKCYAMTLAGTRLREHPSRAGLTRPSKAGPVWTGEVRLNEEWLTQPLRWRRPRMIFVCAHGDLFHEAVPDEWIDRIFAVMTMTPQHTYQVLTKRSARMRSYFTFDDGFGRWGHIEHRAKQMFDIPAGKTLANYGGSNLPNVWLGVSVEDQQRAGERIPDLLATPATVRFVSAEPLLGPVDLTRYLSPIGAAGRCISIDGDWWHKPGECGACRPSVDWVIVGGESGRGARPMHPDWARSLRDQCVAAQVPFFFKQWGEWCTAKGQPGHLPISHVFADGYQMIRLGKKAAGALLDGRDWREMPS
ncbi:phage Gp37/Gp68 family protein [Microbaculum marinum]|uniref:Phage Gp37/Gp68 family protein n=1 Tax=Microbaculum marinum TaxID=1764581 RepID=A0AAW9RCF8_9HYPH